MVNLSLEQLKNLLKEAYDAGWRGSKELRDSIVEYLVQEYEVKEVIACSNPLVTSFVPLSQPQATNAYSIPYTVNGNWHTGVSSGITWGAEQVTVVISDGPDGSV